MKQTCPECNSETYTVTGDETYDNRYCTDTECEWFEEIDTMHKKVNLELVGLDGNAFSVMGAFSKQARREGWAKAEIDAVLEEAMSGDYNHLLATIMGVCE